MKAGIKTYPAKYFLSCAALAMGCSGGGGGSGPDNPVVIVDPVDMSYMSEPGPQRAWLKAGDLIAAKVGPAAPLNNGHFMAVGTSGAALHRFSGTIRLTGFNMHWEADLVPLEPDTVAITFPDVDLQFVSDGDDLIPLNREIQVGKNGTPWRLILEPGKVWSETSDGGWSRASFPFELVSPYAPEIHNGLATFVYNGTTVSALRLQISQKTAIGNRSDMWTILTATYVPSSLPGADAALSAYAAEKAGYWPTGSWDDIAPQLKVTKAAFNANLKNTDISLTGVVWNGTIYRQPCHTRHGDYPYCQQMRGATNSVAKSMGAAAALLRLAQKYGDGVADLRIKDYLTITATHNGWDNVTFLDALNMATGIGNGGDDNMSVNSFDAFMADEGPLLPLYIDNPDNTTASLLAIAFSQKKHGWAAGAVARYDSIDTFVLAAAMDAYLKSKEGPDARLWDMMLNEVYHPIGVRHVPAMKTAEANPDQRLPLLYFGMYPTADDIAKVAQLFQNDGSFNGQQILSPALTRRALYETADQGLPGTPFSRYLMSFWSDTWTDGQGCTLQIPYMSGYGGIGVQLFPNGATVYRISDAGGVANDMGATNLGKMCP